MIKNKEKIEVIDKKGKTLGEGTLEKKRGNEKITKITLQKSSFFRGPLPPANELEKYKRINPKLISCIIKDFERNSKFREDCNKNVLRAQIKLDNKSQNHGFFAVIIMILTAGFCAYYKQTAIGVTLVGASAFSMIKALLPNKEK